MQLFILLEIQSFIIVRLQPPQPVTAWSKEVRVLFAKVCGARVTLGPVGTGHCLYVIQYNQWIHCGQGRKQKPFVLSYLKTIAFYWTEWSWLAKGEKWKVSRLLCSLAGWSREVSLPAEPTMRPAALLLCLTLLRCAGAGFPEDSEPISISHGNCKYHTLTPCGFWGHLSLLHQPHQKLKGTRRDAVTSNSMCDKDKSFMSGWLDGVGRIGRLLIASSTVVATPTSLWKVPWAYWWNFTLHTEACSCLHTSHRGEYCWHLRTESVTFLFVTCMCKIMGVFEILKRKKSNFLKKP